jgi:uncharacterized protein (DUF736 family)
VSLAKNIKKLQVLLAFCDDFDIRNFDYGNRERIANNMVKAMLFCDYAVSKNFQSYSKLRFHYGNLPKEKYENLLRIVKRFCEKLFTSSGAPTPSISNKIEPTLAQFFFELLELHPFRANNHITLRKFFTELAKQPKLSRIIPKGIDFRRMALEHMESFLHPSSYHELVPIFLEVMDNKQEIKKTTVKHKWHKWSSSYTKIEGVRFLTYNNNIVAANGALCPINTGRPLIEEQLRQDRHPDKITLPIELFKGKMPSYSDKFIIDAKLCFGERLPLVCLDVDILTGLRLGSELEEFEKELRMHNISLLELPQSIYKFSSKKLASVTEKIELWKPYIDFLVTQATRNKKSQDHPHFFLTMGGSGSGKSLLKQIAHQKIGYDYVEASLDRSRYSSYIYNLLIEAGHHDDDYIIIQRFASALRSELVNRALAESLNIFFDGSGIPYTNRYEDLVAIMKASGYKVHILAADCPFVIKPGKNTQNVPAYERILVRSQGKRDHRAIPWQIAIEKHIGVAASVMSATFDKNVDELILLSSTIPQNQANTIIAYTNELSWEQFQDIKNRRDNKAVIMEHNLIPETKIFSCPITDHTYVMPIHVNFQSTCRILVITDLIKFNEMLEKAMMNPQAKGLEDIYFNTHPHYIPELDMDLALR